LANYWYCWRSYGTYPGRYGLRLYDCSRIPGILGFRKNQCPEMLTLLQKCWDFRDSTGIRILSSGAGSTKSIFTGTVRHLWLCGKCSENAGIRRWCPTPWNSGARRSRPFTTKTYGTRTTKRISSSSRNALLMIHPHHCSKILFQNEDSHSKNIFWV